MQVDQGVQAVPNRPVSTELHLASEERQMRNVFRPVIVVASACCGARRRCVGRSAVRGGTYALVCECDPRSGRMDGGRRGSLVVVAAVVVVCEGGVFGRLAEPARGTYRSGNGRRASPSLPHPLSALIPPTSTPSVLRCCPQHDKYVASDLLPLDVSVSPRPDTV